MLDYEMFKGVVEEELFFHLPDNLRKFKYEIRPVQKVNQTLDGIIFKGEGKSERVFPTLYLNEIYEDYKRSENLDQVLTNAANALGKGFEMANNIAMNLDMAEAKDNIVFQLINTEQNREMLSDMPHREFQDLSIIYRWVVSVHDDGAIESATVTNNLAESLGCTEKDLYELAVENTRKIMPPKVYTMQEVMKKIFAKDGIPEEIAEMMISEMNTDPEMTMWIISNEMGINGAGNMLYEDQLHKIAENMGDDLYVLPSSVHEVIAVSTSVAEPEKLAEMVNEVNLSQVSIGERLSNQVYHYDKDLRKLTLATDTPNKRLDGIVAEPPLIYETKGQSR